MKISAAALFCKNLRARLRKVGLVEGMELSDLYNTYGKIKKDQVSPRQLLKIVIYAGMNRIYSSRDIEKSCRRDINFMYLLEGKPSPDHTTIARFISLHLSQCSSNILADVSNILYELGEISGRHIFIDGTKIESVSNRYTFVWKKAVTKNQSKLFAKITELIAECVAPLRVTQKDVHRWLLRIAI